MDALTPSDRLLLSRMRELYTTLTQAGLIVKGPNATTTLADSLVTVAAAQMTPYGASLLEAVDAASLRALADVYGTGYMLLTYITAAQIAAAYQPLNTDLSAIALLTTTTYGRSLLTLASLAANQAALKTSAPLFDHHADVGNATTVETDLYSDTLAAGQLGTNDDKIEAEYAGVFVSSGTATRQLKIYFDGQSIFDSGALTLSLSSAWTIYLTIIRVSATVIRAMVSMTTQGAALAAYTAYTEVTGRTLSGTNILKLTGTAAGVGAASNDILSKMGYVTFRPAA